MKTAFQYIRKSNEDQSNFSISGQQTIIEDWAAKRDIKIVRTFIDDGYSAKDFNRPQWKELESVIGKSKIDYLIVMKYDRLIRNVIEGLSFVEKLEKKWKITLISVMENYSIDIHDPYFFKHRADMFVDADFESRRISDRTKFGQWSGRSQGRFLAKAPYGYINQRDDQDKPILVLNNEAKKNIEDIFNDYVNDVPYTVILSKVRNNGFPMKGKDALRRVLSNHTYAGFIVVREYKHNQKKLVKGLHEPIISEDLFWTAYYKLQGKLAPYTRKYFDENLPLRGFLRCESCDTPHTGSKCKGRSAYYYYYWCNKCRGKNYPTKKIDFDIELILKGLSLNERYIDAIKVEAHKRLLSTASERRVQMQRLQREYSEAKTRLVSVEEKYFDKKINDDTYQRWHLKYNQEMIKKKLDIKKLEVNDDEIFAAYENSLPYLSDLNYLYKSSPLEGKQTFLKSIFPSGLSR